MKKNGGKEPLLVICNFIPSPETQFFPPLLANNGNQPSSSKNVGKINILQLWMGDLVEIIAEKDDWCFGRRLEEPEKYGLFPRSHVREFPTRQNFGQKELAKHEAENLADEMGKAVKAWWDCTKSGIGDGEINVEHCEQQMLLIKQMMIARRRLRSGTVPSDEFQELRLRVANAIDAGNEAMKLPMNIRDENGRPIQAEDLSVMDAYKRHEEINYRVIVQSQQILDSLVEDKLAQSSNGNNEWALLISVDHSELARISGPNTELIFGLGAMMKPKESINQQNHSRATRPLTEPFTIRIGTLKGKMNPKISRALFVGLLNSDLHDPAKPIALWMTALTIGPLIGEKGQAKGEEVRQFFAHGQADLSELVKEMEDKEQRELTVLLARKIAICESTPLNGPNGGFSNAQFPIQPTKIPITLTIQLFTVSSREQLSSLNPELRPIPNLRKLKEDFDHFLRGNATEARNEIFVWLRDGDFHGIGKSEKNIEAVASVVDDDGAFQPEAIEILTPDGPIRESSFRCRVWPAEDRPRFNELIKLLLPNQEVRNLHLQILFYNKSVNENKKSAFSSSTIKGPFAVAFLRLLNNFVLCPDDEDELFIYRIERGKNNADLNGQCLNVGYLANLAKRKEMRQSPMFRGVQGRSPSIATLTKGSLEQIQQQNGGMYILCGEKNGLHFQSFVSSQFHCINQMLVQILRWPENEQHLLRLRLLEFCNIDFGELHPELLKFMPHFLDALFQIAEAHPQIQRPVFHAIVQICRFSEEARQNGQKFQSIFNNYVQHLHFPNAHSFLLEHIIWYVANDSAIINAADHKPLTPTSPTILQHRPSISSRDQLILVLKSIGQLIRMALISKSHSELIKKSRQNNGKNEEEEEEERKHFIDQFNTLRSALVLLLGSAVRKITGQNAAIKHLPGLILPLLEFGIYEPIELANFVKEVLDSLSEGILIRQKLLFLGEIIKSELFASQQCRKVLLNRFLAELLAQMPPHIQSEERIQNQQDIQESSQSLMGKNSNGQMEAVHLSAKILADLIDRLFPYSRHSAVDQTGTAQELILILGKCFRPINQTMIILLGDPTHQRCLHALLLAILDKFSAPHFYDYFGQMDRILDKFDSLSEMLHMFRDLMVRCPVPQEWVQIRHLQFRLFLKQIRFASGYVQREFEPEEHFGKQLWLECMNCCVSFAKGAKTFEKERRGNWPKGNGDKGEEIREFAVEILRSLWFSMNPQAKFQMTTEMVGQIMEVALCDEEHLRELVMPIFFDMLATEHCLMAKPSSPSKSIATSLSITGGVVLRKTHREEQQMANSKFGDEFIAQMDTALALEKVPKDDGKNIFAIFCREFNQSYERQIMPKKVEEINEIRIFVKNVNKLLELFSAYLSVSAKMLDGQLEMGMFCTVQLIDFYYSIGQNALYLTYLYKLYNLHISVCNWIEAALTLQRHFNLLAWINERPTSWLYGARKQNNAFKSQLQLKEHLSIEMANLFAKGGHWELAIERNRELANVYETILFDYTKLALIFEKNAELYKKVVKEIRFESNYFLVAFYGKDCPKYFANRKFIFRGQQLELWAQFKQRLLANFSDYKFIDSIDDCDELMANVEDKFIQIIAVSPIPSSTYNSLVQSPSQLASWYYKHHNIHQFELVRREFRNKTKWTELDANESMRLWLHKKIIGIKRPLPDLLGFSPVISEQDQEPMNPLEVAVEKVREANDKLADLMRKVKEGFNEFLMNLGGMIRGIVQADVGGGIKNYQTFFNPEIQFTEEEKRSIRMLKRLILDQITLLEFALFVHANTEQAAANAAFHNSLVDSYEIHRELVETKLMEGTNARSILPEGISIYMPEQSTNKLTVNSLAENRLSAHSTSTLVFGTQNSLGGAITKATRSHSSISESRLNAMASSTSSSNSPQQNVRPPSDNSSSSSGGGSTTMGGALFRSSPFAAASALIRSTMNNKSKQRMQGEQKNNKKMDGTDLQHQSIRSSSQLLSTAISNARTSDASIENCFPMEMTQLAPPLPKRHSNLHSKNKMNDN